MTIESLLKDYAVFNLWANTQMVDWLKSKPQELMEREIPSSYPTLRETLLHIWGAEEIWLDRLRLLPTNTILTERFNGSL